MRPELRMLFGWTHGKRSEGGCRLEVWGCEEGEGTLRGCILYVASSQPPHGSWLLSQDVPECLTGKTGCNPQTLCRGSKLAAKIWVAQTDAESSSCRVKWNQRMPKFKLLLRKVIIVWSIGESPHKHHWNVHFCIWDTEPTKCVWLEGSREKRPMVDATFDAIISWKNAYRIGEQVYTHTNKHQKPWELLCFITYCSLMSLAAYFVTLPHTCNTVTLEIWLQNWWKSWHFHHHTQ